jgi:citrate lyase subunit beta/citryl-CoA lyase
MRTRQPVQDWGAQPLRSLLFAPASEHRKLAKLGSFGSDAIVLDLEDAVPESEKTAARDAAKSALPGYVKTAVAMIRVNGEHSGRLNDDVSAVICADLDAIVVPKVETAETLYDLDAQLAQLEQSRGITPGSVRVVALIETPKGVVHSESIALAAPPRVLTLIFGLGDFSAEIGVDPTVGGEELLYARSRVVVAARAAGMRAPLDGPFLLNLDDFEGLLTDTRRSRQLGFQGRVVVHPSHVEHVQGAYSELKEEELDRIRRVVDAFEAAERSGSAAIRVDQRFIDYPPYRRAKDKLRLYEASIAQELT